MIIDTNQDVTAKLPALRAAGVVAVGRYLNRLDPHEQKVIKPAEARAFAAAAVPLFLIYEAAGRPSGAHDGALDSLWCQNYLPTLGMPADCAIYNTVDYDAGPADMPGILGYFRDFRTPTHYRTGAYGSGYVNAQLLAGLGLDRLRWLSCSGGFRGTKEALAAGAYEMAQSLSPKLDGIDVDVSALREPGIDFGARVPFAAVQPVAPAAPIAEVSPGWLARIREIFEG